MTSDDDRLVSVVSDYDWPQPGPELIATARILELLRQFNRIDVRRRILAYVVDETEHA